MGRDSDDPLALGEVGKCGVAISSLEDMRTLFDGIDLGNVSTSMTINAPAAILLAFYICVAREERASRSTSSAARSRTTSSRNSTPKTSSSFRPAPRRQDSSSTTIEYCTQHMPQWNTVSVSGYHIREAGATAPQELAFTIADGMCYTEAGDQARARRRRLPPSG